MRSRAAAIAIIVGATSVVVAVLAPLHFAARERSAARSAPRVPAKATAPRAARAPRAKPPAPQDVRWLAIAGGATPAQNGVSIEQDVALAAKILGRGGLILFAGGPGSRDVQVRAAAPRGDPLLRELATLFSPSAGRDSRYRETVLPVHAAATPRAVRQVLGTLARASDSALLIYLGGHGERADQAADSSLALWGSRSGISVRDLAALLAGARRPVRLVVTSCFGGAFAEALFAAADAKKGLAKPLRCGVFATTFDLPADGCDPEPQRAAQTGYALHFFNALQRRDRDGRPLAAAQIDFDGDGRISLLEAHSRTRIDSRAVDVPTTTAERWLRAAAPRSGPQAAVALPEERAVVAALVTRTGLAADLPAVRARLAALEQRITVAREFSADATRAEDAAADALAAQLLSRWPVLNDPWHPDFAPLLAREASAIRAYLRAAPAHATYQALRKRADEGENAYWELREQAAPVERLARALETMALAARLRARGGAQWESYAALLGCERAAP